MKSNVSFVGLILGLIAMIPTTAAADTITIGALGNEIFGEINNLPSQPNGVRFQTLYSAFLFGGSPILISGFAYRPSANVAAFSLDVPDLVITLSTTSVPDDGLSNTFASNIGPNATVVYNAPIHLASAGSISGNSNFDILFNFSTPFLYNPSQGNLLVDAQFFGQATGTGGLIVAKDGFGDGLSRIRTNQNIPNCGVDVTSPIGCSLNGDMTNTSRGPATQFTFQPAAVPEPASLVLLATGLAALWWRMKRICRVGN